MMAERKPTIYEVLKTKLDREPTNNELKDEMDRISEEILIKLATAGKLSFQRKRRRR